MIPSLQKQLPGKIEFHRFTRAFFMLLAMVTPLEYTHADSHNPEQLKDAASVFMGLLTGETSNFDKDMAAVEKHWEPSFVAMVLESIRFSNRQELRDGLINILQEKTGQSFGLDLDSWFKWLWAQPEQRHPNYASFKSELYRFLDPVFAGYFDDSRPTTIRLDEIRWGGVVQDGIPPLRQPEMIKAEDAKYLADSDVVFGVKINGDARAYPQRILAWHEMFVDTIGGVDFAGVYCTLCGAVILYETNHNGIDHEVGTSGFLYRSNKVMYDKKTQSLWSTTLGEPTVGPLVGKGIQLKRSYVVTSTWGEWRRRHPDTQVLSIDTGHQRNYGEGVAYAAYFGTDELMFTVPKTDDRLPNKAEILALWYPEKSDATVAISASFLADKPVYHHQVGDQPVVVLTDSSGANRVYETNNVQFNTYDGDTIAVDTNGKKWTLSESALVGADDQKLQRLPAHRAFWFGWYATFNDTELVM